MKILAAANAQQTWKDYQQMLSQFLVWAQSRPYRMLLLSPAPPLRARARPLPMQPPPPPLPALPLRRCRRQTRSRNLQRRLRPGLRSDVLLGVEGLQPPARGPPPAQQRLRPPPPPRSLARGQMRPGQCSQSSQTRSPNSSGTPPPPRPPRPPLLAPRSRAPLAWAREPHACWLLHPSSELHQPLPVSWQPASPWPAACSPVYVCARPP
mmetsp:Transcript_13997/g.26884  ORF Transcript_13997/g.26884 Transcript_13997/m.26884 type:complete len:209 (-) Transcript_13997:901-1527(-)